MLDKNSFKSGVSHSYPICIAFAFMYSALGMLGHAKSISLGEMVAMSATIFAVPLQALLINNQESSLIYIAINAFILNFKFILMSAALVPLWSKRLFNIPSLHFICSSTYMVCSVEKNIKDPWSFYIGVSIPSYVMSIVATVLGYKLWQLGSEYQSFLHALSHIVLPIHFTCLTLKRKKEKFAIFATLLGFAIAPILMSSIGSKFNVLAWIAIASVIIMIEDKICGKQSLQQA